MQYGGDKHHFSEDKVLYFEVRAPTPVLGVCPLFFHGLVPGV